MLPFAPATMGENQYIAEASNLVLRKHEEHAITRIDNSKKRVKKKKKITTLEFVSMGSNRYWLLKCVGMRVVVKTTVSARVYRDIFCFFATTLCLLFSFLFLVQSKNSIFIFFF